MSHEQQVSSTDFPSAPFDPADPSHRTGLAERAAAARATCPVAEPRPGVFVVASFDDVGEVLADTDRFSNFGNFQLERDAEPPGGVELVTQLDPPQHTALRAHLLQRFAPKELRRQAGRISEIVDDVLDPLAVGQTVDVFADIARPVTSRTVYAFLGFPEEDWPEIKEWGDVVNEILPEPFDSVPEFHKLIGYLMELAAARKASPPTGADVLDTLLHAPPDGQRALEPEEAAVHAMQLVFAGTDTTASLIANLLYEVVRDRRHWERLLEDRTLVAVAIEESLRHDSPLQMIMRTAKSETAQGGCPIGARDKLLLSLQSANWDEQAWGDDAAEFSLDRPRDQGHVAMGKGIHACLGAPLARLQCRIVLEQLLSRFPDLRLAPGFSHELAQGVLVRRPSTLVVVL